MRIDWSDIKNAVKNSDTSTDKFSGIDEWVQEDSARQRFFENARRFYDDNVPDEGTLSDDDLSHAWRAVRRRTEVKRRRNLVIKIAGGVASAAAVLLLSILVFNYSNKEERPIVAQNNSQIQFTKERARIVLSSGESKEITQTGEFEFGDFKVKNSNIEVKGGGATSLVDTLTPQYNEIIVPVGETYLLKLSDGTEVTMNADSRLKFPLPFVGKERRVILSGEAFFDVTKSPDRPFIVETIDSNVKVLGTKFNVKARERQFSITTLITGSVMVANGNDNVRLMEGEQSQYNQELGIFEVTDVNTDCATAWLNEEFIFRNESLEYIFNELKHWYNIEVEYANTEVKDEKFYIYFSRSGDVKDVLDKLSLTRKIQCEVNGNRVTVSYK